MNETQPTYPFFTFTVIERREREGRLWMNESELEVNPQESFFNFSFSFTLAAASIKSFVSPYNCKSSSEVFP